MTKGVISTCLYTTERKKSVTFEERHRHIVQGFEGSIICLLVMSSTAEQWKEAQTHNDKAHHHTFSMHKEQVTKNTAILRLFPPPRRGHSPFRNWAGYKFDFGNHNIWEKSSVCFSVHFIRVTLKTSFPNKYCYRTIQLEPCSMIIPHLMIEALFKSQ